MPQIITIIKTKSVKGLSAFSYYSDFVSGVFQGLYCFHIGLTPSIYAEYIVLAIQNIIIILLAWFYSDSNTKNGKDEKDEKEEKVYITEYMKRYLFVILTTLFIYICLINEGKYINNFHGDLWLVLKEYEKWGLGIGEFIRPEFQPYAEEVATVVLSLCSI